MQAMTPLTMSQYQQGDGQVTSMPTIQEPSQVPNESDSTQAMDQDDFEHVPVLGSDTL